MQAGEGRTEVRAEGAGRTRSGLARPLGTSNQQQPASLRLFSPRYSSPLSPCCSLFPRYEALTVFLTLSDLHWNLGIDVDLARTK